MVIYIPLEVAVRELSGHLLLAAAATSKGHQTLIASPSDLWLYKRLNLLPKGNYLLKNMNVPAASQKMYESFLYDGFDLYCQEQEPSILWGDFNTYLNSYNITKDQMFPFKGVFCWGKRDLTGYTSFFKSKNEVFFDTGSPRADLWHPRFKDIWKIGTVGQKKPYILIVSNFGLLMGKRHWGEWIRIHRQNEILKSKKQEDNFIKFIREDFSIALSITEAINYLAVKHPDLNFLIRPHPLDCKNYWENIFTTYNNVKVIDNVSPLSFWISGARAVIQNGCTSALEAVLQKVPVVSYGPKRTHGNLITPNLLGARAHNFAELDFALSSIFNGNYKNQIKSEQIISPLITTKKCNAAFQIIEIMENNNKINSQAKLNPNELTRIRFVRRSKNIFDQAKRSLLLKGVNQVGYKLDKGYIKEQINLIARIIDISPPKLSFVSKTGLLIN